MKERTDAFIMAENFSMDEKKSFYKKKWLKEHIALLVILVLVFIASIVIPVVFGNPYLIGMSVFIAIIVYGYIHNRMMAYVEKNVYD